MLTDERIRALLEMPKQTLNPGAREQQEDQHRRREYRLRSDDGDEEFTVFTRQHAEMADCFSVGLRWHPRSGEPVTLMRCNGSNHRHSNHIEGTGFGVGSFHVHVATERYIASGRSAEHFAEVTRDFRTLAGALAVLTQRCAIAGISTEPDIPDLFDNEDR